MDRSLIVNVRIQIVRRTQLTDTDEGSIFSDLHAANHHSLLLQRAIVSGTLTVDNDVPVIDL